MKIGSIGYNHVHDMKYENFIMDRPKGVFDINNRRLWY